MRAATVPAFTGEERDRAYVLLAAKVAQMMGRTFEENDWTAVYCAAKGIPFQDWSNLHLDINFGGLGVEQKRLAMKQGRTPLDFCGRSLMHPAETRSIRVPPTTTDANDAMRVILGQYIKNLADQREAVLAQAPNGVEPDMRKGWLLYQPGTLREFIYWEERRLIPNPDNYYAVWRVNPAKGARKGGTNLWIYERGTDYKRYSVTNEAGAKIQIYFDVPPPTDPNLNHFIVQGEELGNGEVRIWITLPTARELEKHLGSLSTDALSEAILEAEPDATTSIALSDEESVRPVAVRVDAYLHLTEKFEGVSDEHRVQLLLQYLRSR